MTLSSNNKMPNSSATPWHTSCCTTGNMALTIMTRPHPGIPMSRQSRVGGCCGCGSCTAFWSCSCCCCCCCCHSLVSSQARSAAAATDLLHTNLLIWHVTRRHPGSISTIDCSHRLMSQTCLLCRCCSTRLGGAKCRESWRHCLQQALWSPP